MTTLIPLCVPFERRKEAARGGATFNGEQKCWMAHRDKLDALLPFVPYRYRPDRKARGGPHFSDRAISYHLA
ncbi:hypothetical protein [Acetobacter musti]|uniref:hypothetical protein n=1 Tax=Acetobacter musti TaxID=864732 RepID=UPI00156A9C0E|nr:hypothetical protein [Acetobacter musti]